MSLTVSVVPAFAVARLGDLSSGHFPWPARPNDQASPNVFVNKKGWHRFGDHWAIHCAPVGGCHDGYLVHGAPGVFVNGKPAGRIGDLISCSPHDEFVDQGSPNVFCGNFMGSGPEPVFVEPIPEATTGDSQEMARQNYANWNRMPIDWEFVDRQIHQI